MKFKLHKVKKISSALSRARPAAERQSARMSKITNDSLTRSGTGYILAVPIWQQWA